MEEIYDSINLTRNTRSVLSALSRNKMLPDDAFRWLIHALDPFCDAEFAPAGFPETNQAKSVVQVITRTMDVTKPVSISSITWDAVFVFMPFVCDGDEQFLTSYDFNSGTISDTESHTRSLYPGLNIIACPADSDWLTDPSCIHDNSVQFPVSSASGSFRLTAGGFEVHDVTANLFRQGSVTSASTDLGIQAGVARRLNSSTEAEEVESFMFGRVPPTTLPSLAAYPGASTWSSDRGVYNIWTLGTTENNLTRLVSNQIAIYQEYDHSGGVYDYSGWTNRPQDPLESCILPWNVSQSRFSGLNTQSTLRVTVKYYLERFPGPSQTTLVSLARPPTDYCPLALELYSMALNHLDSYCPVGYNPLGEWFNKVVGALSQVAIPVGTVVGTALGSPELGLIGGELAKAGLNYVHSRNRHRSRSRRALGRGRRRQTDLALADVAKAQLASKGVEDRTQSTRPYLEEAEEHIDRSNEYASAEMRGRRRTARKKRG